MTQLRLKSPCVCTLTILSGNKQGGFIHLGAVIDRLEEQTRSWSLSSYTSQPFATIKFRSSSFRHPYLHPYVIYVTIISPRHHLSSSEERLRSPQPLLIADSSSVWFAIVACMVWKWFVWRKWFVWNSCEQNQSNAIGYGLWSPSPDQWLWNIKCYIIWRWGICVLTYLLLQDRALALGACLHIRRSSNLMIRDLLRAEGRWERRR